MPTGAEILHLAESRLGEKYLNGPPVPKNNPQWHGRWDCAELASWVVFQVTGRLYGCVDNAAAPAPAEANSGAWSREAADGVLENATRAEANVMAGVILIRKPQIATRMGHVAISNGAGKVIETAGVGLGVRRGAIEGRLWHYCALIPGVEYAVTAAPIAPKPLPPLLQLEAPRMEGPLVRKVQLALKAAGFSPGPIDRQYGPNTVAAVYAFQMSNRLIGDGVVGPRTARKLVSTGRLESSCARRIETP